MRHPIAAALTVALTAGGTLALPTAAAEAAPSLGMRALAVAAAQKGDPYQYGGVGPNRFDCSGLVVYSFKKAGRTLPRTAQAQYNRVRHISAGSRRPGDLVFFHSGRSVYHVGIYAGRGQFWDAPHSGSTVHRRALWTNAVWYGRP